MMKKICTVVGARPQFIKLAMVSKVLRQDFQEVLIHTGQHYDYNMSDVFFETMQIPKPQYNLGISGGTHGQMTGKMLIEIEKVLLLEHPDMVLVFGDTNSTMAAALAAVKLHIPVCHVEAGARLGTLMNPEEVNRIVTDHVSSLHLVCTSSGIEFLKKEGFGKTVYLVGDPMYDAFRFYSSQLKGNELYNITGLDGRSIQVPAQFYYLTCHRQENTDIPKKLQNILDAMESLDSSTIYPVHPRNRKVAQELIAQRGYQNIILVEPVSYQVSIALVNHAKKIVTDSGGIQREAFFAKKQCVTIMDHVCWPETMINGCNQLANPDKMDILEKLTRSVEFKPDYQPFGDGHSSEKIVGIIKEFFNKRELDV